MDDKATLTLDRLFNSEDFDAKTFGPAYWLDDDTGYTTLETAVAATSTTPQKTDQQVKEIVQ